jgi:threonine synthase
VKISDCWVLELFHGPTFAFKDVALQFLGNLFEYFLRRGRIKSKLSLLGATSGDTGSAAIHGVKGKKNIDCFVMFPFGKVSEIQERQMTTVMDENIHTMSIRVSCSLD